MDDWSGAILPSLLFAGYAWMFYRWFFGYADEKTTIEQHIAKDDALPWAEEVPDPPESAVGEFVSPSQQAGCTPLHRYCNRCYVWDPVLRDWQPKS